MSGRELLARGIAAALMSLVDAAFFFAFFLLFRHAWELSEPISAGAAVVLAVASHPKGTR